MKPENIKLSNSYIDDSGKLVLHYTKVEKIGQRISKMFNVLPFVVSFMLCSLLVVQVFCLFGLVKTVLNPINIGDLILYAFLFIAISVIGLVGFGIAWFLEKNEPNPKPRTQRSNQKYPNDELDIWQN